MTTTTEQHKAVGIMPPPDVNDPAEVLKINVPRRVSNLLIPTPLPRPVPNKKNELGQQLHQVEIRSGGVIAYRVPLHQKMVVGALSGVIGMSAVFPVDLVKTRLQVLSKAAATAAAGSGGKGAASAGISNVCRDVYARQGIAGFYRGLGATAVMIAPEKAIKLGVNDYLRDVFCNYDRTRETMVQQVAAGAITGLVQVVATNPMEVLKIRLQTSETGASSPLAVVRELGARGLYNGSAVTLMRDVPYNVIFFTTYIQLKRALTSADGHVAQERIFGSGVAAGVVAAWVGTPMDVVKSRIQMRDSPYTRGALDCARRLYGEGGYSIFFRGAIPRMAVQGPLYGISLLFFELQNQYLSSAR
jgi:solute carrier family 25 aspartate/glutamate transporter 12/13